MKPKKITMSTAMKIILIIASISVIRFRYALSKSGKIWFNQIANPAQVENALKDDPRSVDVVDDLVEGYTGLMVAAKNGYVERARLLIKYKAALDIRAKNEADRDDERRYGNTALEFAVLNGDDGESYKVAELLIASGADVTIKNDKGYTALHFILSIGDLKRRMVLMKKLVSAAGNEYMQVGYLNAQNNEGNTMLHLAAQMNRIDWVDMLIKEYGKMIRYDIRNNDKKENPLGNYPENLAKDQGSGGDLARRIKKVRELYATKSDADFKKINIFKL